MRASAGWMPATAHPPLWLPIESGGDSPTSFPPLLFLVAITFREASLVPARTDGQSRPDGTRIYELASPMTLRRIRRRLLVNGRTSLGQRPRSPASAHSLL